jgi:hypothetical protein
VSDMNERDAKVIREVARSDLDNAVWDDRVFGFEVAEDAKVTRGRSPRSLCSDQSDTVDGWWVEARIFVSEYGKQNYEALKHP